MGLFKDDDILKCLSCGKQTTGVEANTRKVRTELCGYCGEMLGRLKKKDTKEGE